MAFFEGFAEKAKVYVDIAADKAKDVAFAAADKAKDLKDTAKINVAILSEQRELDKNYRAIGEWFVAENREVPDGIRDVVSAIAAGKAHIAELEAAKAEKNAGNDGLELKVCTVCGTACNSKFCPECGAPMEQ